MDDSSEFEEDDEGRRSIVEACVDVAMEYFSKRKASFPLTARVLESNERAAELRLAMRDAISRIEPARPIRELRRRSRLHVTGDENVRIRDHVRKNVNKRVVRVKSHVREYVERPPVVKTVDKILFTSGVVWVVGTEYVLLCAQHRMAAWYVFSILPLMTHRVVTYRKSGFIYFCLDFCYFTNLLCFVCIALEVPPRLFEIVFSLCNGPLVFAIVVWRNSFIFHSLDHVCSTMLHALPPLWTFTLRWNGDPRPPMPFAAAYVAAVGTYALWQSLYIAKTEWLDRDYILARKDQFTSLRWIVRDPRGTMYRLSKKCLVSWRLMRCDEEFDETAWLTKVTFWVGQLIYTLLTLLPVPLMWASRQVHAAFLAFMYLTSIYNGASYYIEVFSRRYNLKFDDPKVEDTPNDEDFETDDDAQ
ncbi:hypothetical protein CTAYLR_005103 [Chrysophaeum taylorii]|uniref:Glycerophosphocholine acyltransferase 1 n=1 Tax=Chrysophaeum taylorii TaxID=2483200 RepID=A0AAD7UDX4_9STRA|nr:hypothetical protein CTAYLR_005103 [Chrysophaeum taylorii]